MRFFLTSQLPETSDDCSKSQVGNRRLDLWDVKKSLKPKNGSKSRRHSDINPEIIIWSECSSSDCTARQISHACDNVVQQREGWLWQRTQSGFLVLVSQTTQALAN